MSTDPWAGLDRVEPSSTTGGRRFLARSTDDIDATPGDVVELEMTDEAISYPASCNEVTAAYLIVDGVLHLGTSWSTAMACSTEETELAPRIGALLEDTPRFVIDGDVLTIETADARFSLIDADAPHPDDLPLVGNVWRVWMVVDPAGGGFASAEGATVRFVGETAEVTIDCFRRVVPLTITDAPTAGTIAGLARAATPPPTSTSPVALSTTTTSTVPPTTTNAVPTTPPPPCDPDAQSEWGAAVIDSLAGELTVEVDIDRARLRHPDGSGLDLAVMP